MRRVLCFIAFALFAPAAALAQGSIAGVVKDTSGAVLPGVTVEAASPALIEKTRTVVTDGTGQYKIVDLRPGTYSVTFTLTGFNTVKREGIELSGDFVANINADMKVGAIEETITVTGETPIVDIQSSRNQAIVNKDVLAAIPTGRSHNQIVSLIPGVLVAGQDVGGAGGVQTPGAGQIHGSDNMSGRLLADGLNVGYNGGSANMWMANAAAAQEIVVTTSGGLADVETGGVVTNIIPREGGNSWKATVFASGANSSMATSNYTDALKAQGLRVPNSIKNVYDFNPMFGGPIVKDRLWFFATSRTVGSNNYVAGMFVNRNAGQANVWVPDFDTSRQAVTDNRYITGTIRLTAQATQKNKFGAYFDTQNRCVTCTGGGTATSTIEATGKSHGVPSTVGQVTWQNPVTNRLLLEAGYGYYNQRWGGRPRDDGTFNPATINTTELVGAIPGLSYNAPTGYQHDWTGQQNWRASMSYVTGAHSMKFGYYGIHDEPTTNNYNYTGFSNFQRSNGAFNRFTEVENVDWATLMKVTSLYAQDTWTHKRLTLQGGVRFDRAVVEFTGGDRFDLPTISPNRWVPQPITFSGDALTGANYKDITPRMAATYDLFGNGKTALKVSLGKYVGALNGSTPLNPLARTASSATRSWIDTNKNNVPDCDFSTPGASAIAGGDQCGALSNPAFATSILNSRIDSAAFNGWNLRPYDWDFSTSIQHELLPRVSVNVGYFRRWYGNFIMSDNVAVTPADFDQFSVTAPADSRLPNGGNYVVGGLYNVKPAKFTAIDNLITLSDNYGNLVQHWNGIDVTVNARLKDLTLQGGTSTGRDSWDACDVRSQVPEMVMSFGTGQSLSPLYLLSPTVPYCKGDAKFLTQVKGYAAYTVPRIDVNVAATFQSIPNFVATGLGTGSPGLAANQNVLASQTTLGRLFAGGNANSTLAVNLVQPGTLYGDRINQIDLRFAKILRFRKTRTQVGVDIFNVTNSNAVQTYNQTYVANGAWLTPTSILQARFAKISAQFDF